MRVSSSADTRPSCGGSCIFLVLEALVQDWVEFFSFSGGKIRLK
jgi:hypothetical protein